MTGQEKDENKNKPILASPSRSAHLTLMPEGQIRVWDHQRQTQRTGS